MSDSSESRYDDIIVNSFTEQSAREFRKRVLKKSQMDPNMPILVYIDSYGGNVDALNSMIATMHQVPNQIVTACIGKAMSCGAVLLAAGDHRFCDPMARVLIHEVSAGSIGPVNEIENDAKEVRRLNNQLMEFLAQRCDQTYEEIKASMHKQDSRDINLTASEALEFGIIDYIGMPVIKPMVMYTIETAEPKKYEKSASSSIEEALQDMGVVKKKKKVTKKKATKKKTKKKTTRKK